MQLRKVNGQLKAYKTAIDVLPPLGDFSEFQISDQVANKLKQSSDFLAEDHWCLVVGKHKETELFEWEISILGLPIQESIRGTVDLKNGFPVLT